MTDFVENPGLLEHKRSYSLGAESDLGNIVSGFPIFVTYVEVPGYKLLAV